MTGVGGVDVAVSLFPYFFIYIKTKPQLLFCNTSDVRLGVVPIVPA